MLELIVIGFKQDTFPLNQPEMMIGHAAERFDKDGNLTDETTKEFIRQLLTNLVAWTRRLQQPQSMESSVQFGRKPAAAGHRRSEAGNYGTLGGSTMMRTLSLMATALAVAGIAPFGPSALAQHEHAEHFMKCAKACAECQLQCDSCFKHCLTLAAEGKKEHAKTAQLCADCAECCKTCSTLCARQSPLAGPMLECCAKCCDECAAACEKIPDDKHMAACAKSCRDCARECRDMLKHLGK